MRPLRARAPFTPPASLLAAVLGIAASLAEDAASAPPDEGRQRPALGADVTSRFRLPVGLTARVWAESPQLFNPTNIDVDARGRVWVTEGVNYRVDFRKSKPGDGYLRHPKGDRVVILEDTDGDGAADKSTVFVEDPDLISPLGIAVLGNRVLVSSSPSVFVFTDTNGDDRADKKEVFLTGFGGRDSDHGLHAFTFGPDGKLTFAMGNSRPTEVKDASGFVLRVDREAKGRPPASSDGGVYLHGLVASVGVDGRGLRVLAHNFRNNYESAVDAFGNVWQNDNDDDGNEACRLTFVVEGGSYGYVSADGRRAWGADHRPGQTVQAAHWHVDDPGVVPPTEITGAGSPAGLVVYEGQTLPPELRGLILNAEAGRSTVFGHKVEPAGAGYRTIKRIDFFAPRAEEGDEGRRFRPSDVAVGPDGAVYIADWYDPMVGGHDLRDKTGYGRIFRIAPVRMPARPVPAPDLKTPAGAITALLAPAPSVRFLGWGALGRLGAPALPALRARLADRDPRVRARIVFALAAAGVEGRRAAEAALGDADANVRVAALRALRGDHAWLVASAARLARDSSPALRRELAVSLRDLPLEQTRAALLELAARHDGRDRVYLEAVGIAFRGHEEALYADLLKRLGERAPDLSRTETLSGSRRRGTSPRPTAFAPDWSRRTADLVWRLHPAAAVAALIERARADKVPLAAREQAIVALAFAPSREAAQEIVALAEAGPPPLRPLARQLAFARAGNEWADFGVGPRILALQTASTGASLAGGRGDARAASLAAERAVILKPGAKPEERTAAVEALASDKEGAAFLIGLAARGQLSPELKEEIAGYIFRNPDLGTRALASRHFRRPSRDGRDLPPLAELLRMKGDARRGRDVFFKGAAACSSCHIHGGQGRAVGPVLTEIHQKMGREALFDAILNPSAGIAFGYEPWVITTKDNQTFTGFILNDGAQILLRDISGENRLVPAAEVVHREKEKTSLMPDNIASALETQQLVDVVEFLAAKR